MESLAEKQLDIGEDIERLISNTNKDSSGRKDAKYFQKRLTQLEALWSAFEEGDSNLRREYPGAVEHAYYRNSYDHQIRALYGKYKTEFTSKISRLQGEEVPLGFSTPSGVKARESTEESTIGTVEKDQGVSKVHLSAQQTSQLEIYPDGALVAITQTLRKSKGAMDALERLLQKIAVTTRPLAKAFCDVYHRSIIEYWGELRTLQREMYTHTEDPAEEGYNMDRYIDLETRVHEALSELSEGAKDSPVSTRPISSTSMKLPKIILPSFDGNYLKWKQFHDLYVQMVHNQDLGLCQKMWYLKTHLSGEAERLLRHLPTTDENYATAWKTLVDRYNNKRLLVTALLNQLLGQPTIGSESAAKIKTLHDTTAECVLGLQNLGIDTVGWSPILVHLLITKLDRDTHSLYEQSLSQPKELQSLEGLLQFLETRFQALETLGNKGCQITGHNKGGYRHSSLLSLEGKRRCCFCGELHPLTSCKGFLETSQSQKYDFLKRNNLCFNCLKEGHAALKCTSGRCRNCAAKHNTLLHVEQKEKLQRTPGKPSQDIKNQKHREINASALTANVTDQNTYILLSTVIVNVLNKDGDEIPCRAILDSGSQINLVTEKLARRLGSQTKKEVLSILGIGNGRQTANDRIKLTIKSRVNNFKANIEASILPQITVDQPACLLNSSLWSIPKNIELGDPNFHRPGKIDLLIGAELYFQLLAVGQIKLGRNQPTLQNTILGWIAAGRVQANLKTAPNCGICTEESHDLKEQLEKFWKMEETDTSPTRMTNAEMECEAHFSRTVKQDRQGRFIVRLPFSQEPSALGDSKEMAFRRFYALERKLNKNPELKRQYHEFMQEYLDLGHMEVVVSSDLEQPHYIIPHHCILKPESSTTKLRVVFDASAKTSTNISLNDILHTGPSIQKDLFTILLRFRLPRFVFTADVEKMFRQVWIAEEDRRYQLILWRTSQQEPVKYYRLCTVTYGMTSASYLAIKCLQRTALQASKFTRAGQVITGNVYVDDVMTGANTLREALDLQESVRETLLKGGFNLRKWGSNHTALVKHVKNEDRAIQLDIVDKAECYVKTLGLSWLPLIDEFAIKYSKTEQDVKVTKRTILSEIAHLFDPLGLISPVIITAKILLQQLWNLDLDWDAAVPMEINTRWRHFRQSLETLNSIRIPRHVVASSAPKDIQIHAFSDASEKAYGAAIYVRIIRQDGVICVRLLCSKSKVAPLKTTTIPRLELCAAKLSSELMQRIKQDLQWEAVPYFMWTDSEVVLAWLRSEPNNYHTFVANRIAAIQEIAPASNWRHVSSIDNPADMVSRGIAVEQLASKAQWFYGPLFLHSPQDTWPRKDIEKASSVEKKQPKISLAAVVKTDCIIKSINNKNSFDYLHHVMAYVHRFIKNTREHKREKRNLSKLSVAELEEALTSIVREMQRVGFPEDLKLLQQNQTVHKTSPLSTLAPFLDSRGIIRVGGRLEASSLSYDAKYPMLLPYSHPITKLLVTRTHLSYSHAGPQATLAIVRQRYWPIKGKMIARTVVNQCVRCFKVKPQLLSQFMGNLPAARIEPARPFINSGVDFCGPLWIHYKLRRKIPQKCYVAIFCCFTTKAVHIEVVSDLTTDAFIAALKRFVSRRGNCKNIHCDNATNFVGARNQLKELQKAVYTEAAKSKIWTVCTARGIDFHFIPPSAPHFGGLWEAAVKSAKYLMRRSIANASVTYEELETVMVEIEGILNSRPLTPMSANPNDLTALTPGHFLIGEPLTAMVDPHSEESRITVSQRWRRVSALKQEFWGRWTKEYLNELRQRYKWPEPCKNVEPNTMVLIKNENTPALKWPLGRVVNCIKGNDGLVRVVDVRTSVGILRRHIDKLARLPIEDDQQETSEPNEIPPGPSSDRKGTNRVHRSKSTHCASKRGKDSARPEHSKQGSSTNKRRRYGIDPVSLLLLIFLIIPICGTRVQVTPFNKPIPLYFESMGPAHVFSTEWNLVVYYNLSTYWDEFSMMHSEVSQLRDICSLMRVKSPCAFRIAQLESSLLGIEANNQLLTPEQEPRIKRSPLNIVGNIASALFGVLDSDYAEHMSQIINKVENNEQHLLALLKNQTSIIDSTVNLVQKTQEAAEVQHNMFQRYLNHSTSEIQSIKLELRDHRYEELFNAGHSRLTLLILKLQQIQDALIDVLIDCQHGKISSQLLSSKQLEQQFSLIKGHLPPALRLPTEYKLREMYQLMTIEGRSTEEQIIFRIRLPLTLAETFELLRIIPLPFSRKQIATIIEPSSTLLLVNLHRDLYHPMSIDELRSCVQIKSIGYICKQRHPLLRKGSHISSCELDFLTKVPNPTFCRFKPIAQTTQWIQLQTANHWIFTTYKNVTLHVVCGLNISQQTLTGSGILHIGDGCLIKEEHAIITTHNLYSTRLRTAYTPFLDLSQTPEIETPTEPTRIPPFQHIKKTDIDTIQQQLNILKRQEVLPEPLTTHDIHSLCIGYGSFLLIVTVIIILIYRYFGSWKELRIRQKGSVHKRRHSSHFKLGSSLEVELGAQRGEEC